MIKSMTGYGKTVAELPGYNLTIECRTLNSKQLDLNMRIPQQFRAKELDLRRLVSNELNRGKVDFVISYEESKQNNAPRINHEKALEYYHELKALSEELHEIPENGFLALIARLPDVFYTPETEFNNDDWQIVEQKIQEALDLVNEFRSHEGAIMEGDFRMRIQNILGLLERVPEYEESRVGKIRERIESSLAQYFSDVRYDENRLEQEIIFYIEKLDITEEKIRLKKHCDYFTEILDAEELVGKKLAFVLQEIGREINTLGSKANDAMLQKLVVLMKDELEKLKEQMLNVL
jgi:uncharacterized protein (TIGR00255 family)